MHDSGRDSRSQLSPSIWPLVLVLALDWAVTWDYSASTMLLSNSGVFILGSRFFGASLGFSSKLAHRTRGFVKTQLVPLAAISPCRVRRMRGHSGWADRAVACYTKSTQAVGIQKLGLIHTSPSTGKRVGDLQTHAYPDDPGQFSTVGAGARLPG